MFLKDCTVNAARIEKKRIALQKAISDMGEEAQGITNLLSCVHALASTLSVALRENGFHNECTRTCAEAQVKAARHMLKWSQYVPEKREQKEPSPAPSPRP